MFRSIKKIFIRLPSVYKKGNFCESGVPYLKGPIKCLSLNKHPCQAQPTLVDVNPDEALFYQFTDSIKIVEGAGTLLMIYMLAFVFQIK